MLGLTMVLFFVFLIQPIDLGQRNCNYFQRVRASSTYQRKCLNNNGQLEDPNPDDLDQIGFFSTPILEYIKETIAQNHTGYTWSDMYLNITLMNQLLAITKYIQNIDLSTMLFKYGVRVAYFFVCMGEEWVIRCAIKTEQCARQRETLNCIMALKCPGKNIGYCLKLLSVKESDVSLQVQEQGQIMVRSKDNQKKIDNGTKNWFDLVLEVEPDDDGVPEPANIKYNGPKFKFKAFDPTKIKFNKTSKLVFNNASQTFLNNANKLIFSNVSKNIFKDATKIIGDNANKLIFNKTNEHG